MTTAGMIGGGDPPRPGEIALAHRGVLFLDELTEFGRPVLEALRQPMEEGRIVLARARWRVAFPASFILVGSMNPCPCGRGGTPGCTCDPSVVRRYQGRVSGPIRDRIDVHVQVDPVRSGEWLCGSGESTASIARRVAEARTYRTERLRGGRADAGSDRHTISGAGRRLLVKAIDHLGLSGRAIEGIGRVARTISDLEHCEAVRAEHVAEAIQFRTLDRTLLPAD